MKLPIFQQLPDARNVLIAGMGGDFDVFAGLPLYVSLKEMGKTVHLANLSFTELGFCDGERPVPSLMRVTPQTSGPSNYFPEGYLTQWLAHEYGETPVFAIERAGVRPVSLAYQWLNQALSIDTLILVDGGMDSLMRGDEAGLGTPQEDMASLAAASAVTSVTSKFLLCVGFGVDAFHGICHTDFLENTAALIADGGFLGSWSLLQETKEFQQYQAACEFVSARMPRHPSIVNTSIICAVKGEFGDYHATKRTEGSTLFINPLMAIYWAFQLDAVARRNLYLDRIRGTNKYGELSLAIEAFRASLPKTKPWREIPC
jgi:hypothetical protein